MRACSFEPSGSSVRRRTCRRSINDKAERWLDNGQHRHLLGHRWSGLHRLKASARPDAAHSRLSATRIQATASCAACGGIADVHEVRLLADRRRPALRTASTEAADQDQVLNINKVASNSPDEAPGIGRKQTCATSGKANLWHQLAMAQLLAGQVLRTPLAPAATALGPRASAWRQRVRSSRIRKGALAPMAKVMSTLSSAAPSLRLAEWSAAVRTDVASSAATEGAARVRSAPDRSHGRGSAPAVARR